MKRGIVLGLCLLSSLLSLTVQAQDTLYVYGGPSTLEGKFEDVAGLPDRQGWQGVDLTALPANRWHIDNFHCANLDPTTPDNHAWWCGEVYVSCGLNDPPEGYGNGYEEYLDWYGVVPDTTVSVTVTVEAMLNYDNEPGYDYLYLKLQWGTGWLEQQDYNGQADSVVVVETFSLDPENYVPHPDSGEPSVHLRWEFTSDSGWSDEDCDWPTAGAAQIDLIKVFFDQGGGPVQIGETETCEAGDPQQWEAIPRPGVGDFSKVWPLLDDIDPDPAAQNDTPQFAFIDDGIVVPGTGGTPCITWCYGPDGWVVPNQHDLGECLTNEIWSPPIDLPETEYDMVVATWDEYQHNDLTYYCQSMLWLWHVRSTADPTGQDGWSAWEDRDFVYYGGPRYFRRTENITEFLVPDACYVQLALGTWEAEIWGWCLIDNSPAPYFDNVAVYTVSGLSAVPDAMLTLQLHDPVPNPFNPATRIDFTLPSDSQVELTVYDLQGRLVRVLLNERLPAGNHDVNWNGRDVRGAEVAAGTYLFRLRTENQLVTKKGTLLK